MAVREVAFELECFEWADERLELAGRWKGLAGRRLARPVLSIDTGTGRRKRLVALPGGHLGTAEDDWRATFEWPGDAGEIIAAELEVGGSVVVDLPLPDRRRRRRKRAAPDSSDELLRNEVAALRAQVERLRAELAGRERENMQLRAQLDEPEGVAGADAPTVEIERLASERQQLTAEVERLQGERDAATEQLVQQRAADEHARELIDDLRQAIADAAAEAEEARDRQRAELAALQSDLDAERAQSARLRVELAERPPLPPPATVSGRRTAAAPAPPAVEEPTEADTEDTTQPAPVLLQAASLPGALDPPGPLRAGARPAAQPGGGVSMPGWPRSRSGTADLEEDDDPTVELGATAATAANGTHGPARAVSLQALRSRLEQLFTSDGHAADTVEAPIEETLPGPRRTATAARARAGASFAARRSQTEVWGLRILALALVAVLLLAFVLILLSVA